MAKSYFMRSYNFIIFLLKTSLFAILLGAMTKYFASQISNTKVTTIQQLSNITNSTSTYLIEIGFFSVLIAFVLISIELVNRFRSDKIGNYIKSIYYTMLFRHFLIQTERTEKVMTIETQTITTCSPINNTFNRAVRKCIVDIRQDTVAVFVKIPSKQQAQKLLNEMESQVKEEIANRNPDFYFSSPTRAKNTLWFEGKRR